MSIADTRPTTWQRHTRCRFFDGSTAPFAVDPSKNRHRPTSRPPPGAAARSGVGGLADDVAADEGAVEVGVEAAGG
ncbi:MAG: hypothetical protein KDB35_03840, partial [Acidimicrobiales bacterium]|nr:hypothetical protein [Acidimicrobiales bacterium]